MRERLRVAAELSVKNTSRQATQRMLTTQLRELERDALITRKVFAGVPPRANYALSSEGKSLLPILTAMCEWGSGASSAAKRSSWRLNEKMGEPGISFCPEPRDLLLSNPCWKERTHAKNA